MAKVDVAKETLSRAAVEGLLSHWNFPGPLEDFSILYGGYSGTSVRVVGARGAKFVLKVCHGYALADVEAQARVAVYARANGFTSACTAYALRGKPSTFAVERSTDGVPCCLLSWVDGVAADKVVAAGSVAAADVLRAVGSGLGRLHSVAPPADWDAVLGSLRAIETGGGCDLRLHTSGEIQRTLRASAAVRGHAFLPWYDRQLESLQSAVGTPGLPRGLLHGDPFLDNALVSPTDGRLEGFVDLEDLCVGPLLFDIACCACACCFRPNDGGALSNALDMGRMRALLHGYASERPLVPAESKVFVAFMRATMLCNWCAAPCPRSALPRWLAPVFRRPRRSPI